MEEHFFKFSNLSRFPEIIHGVSTRVYGNMKYGWSSADIVDKNRKHFFEDLNIESSTIISPEIVHGSKISSIGREDKGKILRGNDGLISQDSTVYILITIADCLPVFLYDPVARTIGLIHVGWRGILDGIVSHSIGKCQYLGSDPSNLVVGIGPGICQKHFIVKNDVLKKFKDLYPQATFIRNHDGYIDLRKAVLHDLKKANVSKHNVEITQDCPVCLNGIYGSYRKEGEKAPASAAVIGIKD